MLAGCVKPPATMLSRAQLVGQYNANARQVPRLWARAKIALLIRDEQGRLIPWGSTSPLASPNGLLLLAKDRPGQADFTLIGREAGQELFRLGIGPRGAGGPDAYYLWYKLGQQGQAYWGLRALAGAEGIDELPLDPVHLVGVLGVVELPDDFTRLPTVAVTMQDKPPYAYVATYVDRQPVSGDILFRRRLYLRWSDTAPPRPFRMDLLDNAGRTVMVADLADYQGIAAADVPAGESAPVMPADITLTWPGRGSRIHIVLSEMTAADTWDATALEYRPPPGLASRQVDAPLVRALTTREAEP